VPLTMPLREHSDGGAPLVVDEPDDPAAQAIQQLARGVIATSPHELETLPLYDGDAKQTSAGEVPAEARKPAGMSLPMA
jgi:MinD-like ATPase involved in chromosome partitioning or flagellar assembly